MHWHALRAQGNTRQLCCMTLDNPDAVVMGKEPIMDGERVLGYVTSANYGHTIGRGIVYGYLPIRLRRNRDNRRYPLLRRTSSRNGRKRAPIRPARHENESIDVKR